MITKLAFPTLVLAGLSGCAIHQTVQPVDKLDDKQVCVVESPEVKPGVLEAYQRALSAKGYQVRQLAPTASLVECRITSTYVANWRWDLALYLAYAQINVYDNGKPVGKATYDATRGGGNMGKFIDADSKIVELVNQLFPGGAGS